MTIVGAGLLSMSLLVAVAMGDEPGGWRVGVGVDVLGYSVTRGPASSTKEVTQVRPIIAFSYERRDSTAFGAVRPSFTFEVIAPDLSEKVNTRVTRGGLGIRVGGLFAALPDREDFLWGVDVGLRTLLLGDPGLPVSTQSLLIIRASLAVSLFGDRLRIVPGGMLVSQLGPSSRWYHVEMPDRDVEHRRVQAKVESGLRPRLEINFKF
jgi:hypothetical protein